MGEIQMHDYDVCEVHYLKYENHDLRVRNLGLRVGPT